MDSLYGRLTALLLVVLALVAGLQVAVTFYSAQRYFQEVTQDVNRDVAQQVAKHDHILVGDRFDRGRLKQLFSDLMTTHPSIEVYALDPRGSIVAFSAPPRAVVRETVDLKPVREVLGGARLPVLGDDPRTTEGRKVFSVAPVKSGNGAGPLAGYIYVVLEGQRYASAVQRLRGSYILRQSVLAIVAIGLFALLASAYLLRVLTRHVRRLAAAMDAFEASGFTQPPPLTVHTREPDEIARLENAFKMMAARMGDQVKQIRYADASRREMLANVSHDLRTPLASLQGYLDTLLMKEAELEPAQQREFLLIAARQSERLGTLIEDLLELARLDSPQLSLNREPVSMAELVQDSLQKFAQSAAAKSVQLEGQLAQHLLPVNVDVRLMARAIDNLLDNALRHTAAGGRVVASVVGNESTLEVSIEDDGCGIAAEELPRVFDRFYRVASTQEPQADDAPKCGLGLGLAIAKQIIERHGASLDVESTVGVGTCFTFELTGVAFARSGTDS